MKRVSKKQQVLESLIDWSKQHDPLDIGTMLKSNPKLLYDIAETGLPKSADPILKLSEEIAKKTISRAGEKAPAFFRRKAVQPPKLTKHFLSSPESKLRLMHGVPVGRAVVKKLLGDPGTTISIEKSAARILDALKSSKLSKSQVARRAAVAPNQARSLLRSLISDGKITSTRQGKTKKFSLPQ
ncbi:MAG: hypothetical protein E8D47_12915 [Nitrospira sp.]|nr:MAG: hypothetical protein E8D47_12915 [Nitrospira sp.]